MFQYELRQEGRQKERIEAIQAMYDVLKSLGLNDSEAARIICQKYSEYSQDNILEMVRK